MAIKAKVLGTTGDKDLFAEDGGVVYENDYGVQYEFWQWDEGDEGGRNHTATVYRCNVEPDVFAYHDWANVKGIADMLGMSQSELREIGKSSDPMERVIAIDGIAHYHGAANLDGDPLRMPRKELRKRYPGL
jgi:hypothetical protein